MAEISGTLSEGALARSSSHGKWYTLIPPIKKKNDGSKDGTGKSRLERTTSMKIKNTFVFPRVK